MEGEIKPRFAPFFAASLGLAIFAGGIGSILTLGFLESSPAARQTLGLAGSDESTSLGKQEIVLEESSAIIDVAEKISPSVVSIVATRNVEDLFGNVFEQTGGGTGFVITSDGLILTNKHVVNQADATYTVLTSDGKDYTARVLALDPVLDLAIVKIDASGLRPVELGSSDDLEIGQWVVAIGNALAEFQNSVTVGVVSAKDRQITASGEDGTERLEGLIQTDAAINPGNSGGPLLNLRGQVVGINTAIAGDAQNIGFAIPINVAKAAIESVQATGEISRPMLGIRYVPITKEIARLEDLPVDQGALIAAGANGQSGIIDGGPAGQAGLAEGDIITKFNGEEITETRSLARLLQQYNVGDTVTVEYLRDSNTHEVTVVLSELE